ncbi:MAG TPA: tetratricopeptide repeat protein [Streptosporangiaceae bacterium]
MARWIFAVSGSLAVFAVCWWAWYAIGLPPAGANRLAVAVPVAAVLSAALSGPLVSWAGRDRPGAMPGDGQGAPRPVLPAGTVVVGEIPRQPPAFVARATVGRLAAAAGSGRVAVLCAVTGLRGVGKTQVAAAYARDRIAAGWGLVGWVNAESRDVLLSGLARVADAVGAADPEGDSAESARRLREHLETRAGSSLLVLDNAADPDGLRPFLPAAGGMQIVVTSTDRAFAEMGVAVDVSVFTRPESVGYLAERTGSDDAAGAGEVAAELGDLPLGLAQAAATIRGRYLTYRAYLELLSRVPVERLLGRAPGGDYPRPAAAALLLSVQAAEDGDASGLTGLVLRVVAALSPDGVRRDLLGGLAPAGAEDAGGGVDAAVQRCAAWSLLTWSVTGDAVIMHRLLGRVLRERDQAAGQWAGAVEAALGMLEPLLFPEGQAWARRVEGAGLAVQVQAVWDADAAAGAGDPDLAARLLRARSWAVRQFRAAADLGRAIDAGARTFADCVRVLGEDHPQTLGSRNNLAYAYESAGRLGEAIPLYEQTLADRVRVLGEDHPQTLGSRNNLAGAYESAGRLGEAIPLYEQTLADSVRVLGEDHPDTLASRNNLAYAYQSAGRLGEAIPGSE